MHDARRRDQLICGITTEVETGRSASDGQVERPHVKTRQSASHLGVIEVQRDSPELCELRQLPQDDGRDAPRLSDEKIALPRSHVAPERVNQDVRVKIQHRRPT